MKTVNLETAKKLKEAGWPQNVGGHWVDWGDDMTPKFNPYPNERSNEFCTRYAAPDISELLGALPFNSGKDVGLTLGIIEDEKVYIARYGIRQAPHVDTCPAEALASLWLELKKKNLI